MPSVCSSTQRIGAMLDSHAFLRLPAGDTVREIARNGLMGRDRLGALRTLAQARGWLSPQVELSDDVTLAAALGTPRRATSAVSSVESLCEVAQHPDDPTLAAAILDENEKTNR